MRKALKDKSILKLNRKVREKLQQAQTDSETVLLSAEVFIQSHISLKLTLTCLEKPVSVHDLKRFFDIQNAFAGSASQTGPPIAICKIILGMKFIFKQGQAQLLDRSVCTLIGDCKVDPFRQRCRTCLSTY